jgi:glycosyltransferase involved in cell wall biosynthesis
MPQYFFPPDRIPMKRVRSVDENLLIVDPKDNGIQVLISSHNDAPYLKRCLYSVEKALKGYKWILIFGVDACTDETFPILQLHRSTADNVIIKHFSKAANAAQAKNRLIKEATAYKKEYPWICLMDADDAMSEHRIRHLLPMAVKHKCKAVFGDYVVHRYKSPQPEYKAANEDSQINGRIGPWSTLLHGSLLPEDGILFPETMDAYEDSALWLQWIRKRITMMPCPGVITHHYYERENSVSNPAIDTQKTVLRNEWTDIKPLILRDPNYVSPRLNLNMILLVLWFITK